MVNEYVFSTFVMQIYIKLLTMFVKAVHARECVCRVGNLYFNFHAAK